MATKKPSPKKLIFRYTEFPFLIDMLCKQELTFLSPDSWVDKNDAYYLKQYGKEKNLRSVLALCFTKADETSHLWQIFAGNSNGVRIEFNEKKLVSSLKANQPKLRAGPVTYNHINYLKKNPPKKETWPFLKRCQFKVEEEFRIIYEGDSDDESSKSVPFDISSIERIVLSSLMTDPVAGFVTSTIKKIPDCSKLNIRRSRLTDNKAWQAIITPKETPKKLNHRQSLHP